MLPETPPMLELFMFDYTAELELPVAMSSPFPGTCETVLHHVRQAAEDVADAQ